MRVINKSTIVKSLILIMILLQLSYGKLLGGAIPFFDYSTLDGVWALVYAVFTVLIVLTSFALVKFYKNKYLFAIVSLSLFVVMIGNINGIYRNKIFPGTSAHYSILILYIFIAIPLYNLLRSGKWDLKRMIKFIVWATTGAYIFRGVISYLEGVTGEIYFNGIVLEYAPENYYRNDSLRLNPPCLSLIYLPLVYYLFITGKRRKDKVIYILMMILDIWYAVQIHQARSVMIYHAFALVIMWMLTYSINVKKVLKFVALMIGVAIVASLPFTEQLIQSFSQNNAVTGASTRLRLQEIVYFGEKYLKDPVFGIGFVNPDQSLLPGGYGGLGDIGFLGSIYRLGVPMILLYFLMFYRCGRNALKIRTRMRNEYVLLVGLLAQILMTGVNIDCFYGIYAFSVPFFVAIYEYINYFYESHYRTVSKDVIA